MEQLVQRLRGNRGETEMCSEGLEQCCPIEFSMTMEKFCDMIATSHPHVPIEHLKSG